MQPQEALVHALPLRAVNRPGEAELYLLNARLRHEFLLVHRLLQGMAMREASTTFLSLRIIQISLQSGSLQERGLSFGSYVQTLFVRVVSWTPRCARVFAMHLSRPALCVLVQRCSHKTIRRALKRSRPVIFFTNVD